MPKLTCITEDGYHGFDGDVEVRVAHGDTFDVSDQKAAQLRADFPDWFDFGARASKRAATPADEAKED